MSTLKRNIWETHNTHLPYLFWKSTVRTQFRQLVYPKMQENVNNRTKQSKKDNTHTGWTESTQGVSPRLKRTPVQVALEPGVPAALVHDVLDAGLEGQPTFSMKIFFSTAHRIVFLLPSFIISVVRSSYQVHSTSFRNFWIQFLQFLKKGHVG